MVATLLACLDGLSQVRTVYGLHLCFRVFLSSLRCPRHARSLPPPQARASGKPVLVLAATSRPESLDSGLRRAGRFDRELALQVQQNVFLCLLLDSGRLSDSCVLDTSHAPTTVTPPTRPLSSCESIDSG